MNFKREIASHEGITLSIVKESGAAAYILDNNGDSKSYPIENYEEWESMRHEYECAVEDYNKLVPTDKAIPMF
jgi:hypothetical protein